MKNVAWTKVTALMGLVAASATALIASDFVTLAPFGPGSETVVEPVTIGLITGVVGIFFPTGTEPVSGGLPGEDA